jgi:ubiquinone/menaquinone biosynthesis C-methylase UbiE
MRLRRTSARWFPPCSPLVVALSGERVLDIACGTGLVARLAAQRVGRTENVIGLDLNPGILVETAIALLRHVVASAMWSLSG